jgi:tRNA pseudouridine13 synthase
VSAPPPPPRGIFKARPEDFVVEEIPLYEPSGEGDHLYLRFTKRNLPTDAVVKSVARALGVDVRDIGVPGLKDKVGVTTQTISIPLTGPGRDAAKVIDLAANLAIEGVVFHEARRHANKLRTGHLAGNRFTIVVRDVEAGRVGEVIDALERIGREGAPNAFGTQRFGREGDNAKRAQAWLRGEWAGPRDGRARRFLWSSLQSAIFNDVLARRRHEGTWRIPLEGDVLQKEDSGGLFLCANVHADRARAETGEVSPTGPIVGVKMRAPTGAPLELESEVTTLWLGEAFDLSRVRALGEGTRRSLRTPVSGMRVAVHACDPGETSLMETAGQRTEIPRDSREQRPGVRVEFVLPKGAYATTVLSAALTLDASTTDEVTREGARGHNSSADEPRVAQASKSASAVETEDVVDESQ